MEGFRSVYHNNKEYPIEFPTDISSTTLCKYSNLIWNQLDDIQKQNSIINIRFELEYPTQHGQNRKLLLKCHGPFIVMIHQDTNDHDVEGVQQLTIQQFYEQYFFPFGTDHSPTIKINIFTAAHGYLCFYSFHEHFDEIMNNQQITEDMLNVNQETFSDSVREVYRMVLDIVMQRTNLNNMIDTFKNPNDDNESPRYHELVRSRKELYFDQILNTEPFKFVYTFLTDSGNVPEYYYLKHNVEQLVQQERNNEPILLKSWKLLSRLYDQSKVVICLTTTQYNELLSIIKQSPTLTKEYKRVCVSRDNVNYR